MSNQLATRNDGILILTEIQNWIDNGMPIGEALDLATRAYPHARAFIGSLTTEDFVAGAIGAAGGASAHIARNGVDGNIAGLVGAAAFGGASNMARSVNARHRHANTRGLPSSGTVPMPARAPVTNPPANRQDIAEISVDANGNTTPALNGIRRGNAFWEQGHSQSVAAREGAKKQKMDVAMTEEKAGATTTLAAKSSGAGTASAKETPVIWHPPNWKFFTETHTHVCKCDFYTSFGRLGTGSTTQNSIYIRMNSWRGMFEGQASGVGVLQVAGNPTKEGMSGTYYVQDGVNNSATLVPFPITLANSGTDPNIVWTPPVPWYTNFFEKIYDNYTVLECRWKAIISNPNTNSQCGVVVFWDYDAYGSSSTGNVMPQASLGKMLRWPGVNKRHIGPRNTYGEKSQAIIEGVWRPGEHNHNVFNDADLKTWAATGSPPQPNYYENLQFRFFRDDLQEGGNNVTGPDVNVKWELEYVVQFKDLKEGFRYPNAQTDVTLNVPGDIIQK